MSRRIRSIPCGSNGSFIGDGGSSSTMKQEKNISGTCFRGQSVMLLQSGTLNNPGRWFIRCPLWKIEDMDLAQLGATREIDLKIIMKMRKIHGEIKTVRVWVVVNVLLLLICLGLSMVQLRNN
ncbi:hypothetical protein PIB30_027154 [Stylosanthes scabra]|uniref:Uncharacterized protein n=1 Tax=Stylosanthes scabra TaxID=79078 RepID=A0ABU6ZBW8_9FABA|nr:hypothetical protein [Stylosanthes scabra]